MINEEHALVERLRHAVNSEYIRRSLIKYFIEKGFAETFRRTVYPPMLQDMGTRLPELANKIEVSPFVKETNPATGQVTLGWRLYVLGTQRMELGETTHTNMAELMRASYGPTPQSISAGQRTPQDIIDFVVKVLRNDKMGMIKAAPQSPMPEPARQANRPKTGPSQSAAYYEKRKNY